MELHMYILFFAEAFRNLFCSTSQSQSPESRGEKGGRGAGGAEVGGSRDRGIEGSGAGDGDRAEKGELPGGPRRAKTGGAPRANTEAFYRESAAGATPPPRRRPRPPHPPRHRCSRRPCTGS